MTVTSDTARVQNFRYDINALRAAAVTGVVLYHFHIPGFQGGFAGVDVFFVISGFLMTGIIDRRIGSGRLDIAAFYAARVRRIVPALAVMLLALLIFSLVALDPLTAEKVGLSALTSVGFVSNIHYFLTQDYFAGPAESNWLLHTWSLSAEWQFYILYPLIFAGFARLSLSRPAMRRALIVLALGSLLLTLAVASWGGSTLARSSFYLLPARAWEMLAGGIVALSPACTFSSVSRRVLLSAGVAAIAACFFWLRVSDVWPSAWTLAPTAAAVLVLWSAASAGAITGSWPVRYLGLWSYSIYLWHWPIVVGIRYFSLDGLALAPVLGILASIGLGALSYYVIERRLVAAVFARGVQRGVLSTLALCAGLACIAAAGATTTGFSTIRTQSMSPDVRASLDELKIMSRAKRPEPKCGERFTLPEELDGCVVGRGAKATLIVGDSHAAQVLLRYSQAPDSLGRRIISITKNGCAILPGTDRSDDGHKCRAATDLALKEAASGKYDRVILLSSWRASLDNFTDGGRGRICFAEGGACVRPKGDEQYKAASDRSFGILGERLAQIRQGGAQVFLVTGFPVDAKADPLLMYQHTYLKRALYTPSAPRAEWLAQESMSRDGLAKAAEIGHVQLLDAAAALCGQASCAFADAGGPHQFDAGHYRAEYLRSDAFKFLDEIVLPWRAD